jgi:hypothetical protein
MDLPLPQGTQANFEAAPQVGELGVVSVAREIAAYLSQLGRTPTTVHYRDEGPDQLTSRLTYQLVDHVVELIARHGDLELLVDGVAVELPFSPREPAWAVAWATQERLDSVEASAARPPGDRHWRGAR